eukprot:3058213-Rhodomonas_salina.1
MSLIYLKLAPSTRVSPLRLHGCAFPVAPSTRVSPVRLHGCAFRHVSAHCAFTVAPSTRVSPVRLHVCAFDTCKSGAPLVPASGT